MTTLKVPVSKDDHIQGDMKAPLILVEYGDYQCPFCGEAYFVIKQLQEYFGKNLCFIFRNFPLAEMHPQAEMAAETAEFAGIHKRFWEAHDFIYENQDQLSPLSPSFFIELVAQLKLPVEEYKTSLEQGVFQEKIKKDFLGGVRSGVNGTPTFYLNGERYNGSYDLDAMIEAFQLVLNAYI